MRHRHGYRKLQGPTDQRFALLRSLTEELVSRRAITTTLTRAKEVRSYAEKLVTLARRGDLTARRRALALLPRESAVRELFTLAADGFEGRTGGYTRIYRLGLRRGDATQMARIELK